MTISQFPSCFVSSYALVKEKVSYKIYKNYEALDEFTVDNCFVGHANLLLLLI